MGTSQLDLVMLPKQFDVHYIAADGSKKMPWVIHRAVLGSFERFIGMILEHTDGNLPAWLSPVQAVVAPVGENHLPYARELQKLLLAQGVRARVDEQNATVSKKIREAEIKRIPYIVVVGDKEMKDNSVSIRKETKSLTDFLEEIGEKIKMPEVWV